MKERIQKQLESLREQRQMLIANLNGTDGAIAVLESLLKDEKPDTSEPVSASN